MNRQAVMALGLMCVVSLAEAMNWHSPQPWRADAVVMGRDADYGDDRFLHLFSYRHLNPRPAVYEQGIRGTGGSLDSARLYYDFQYRQQFEFDNPDFALSLDVQRSEDFDGDFDRQLVGLHWQFAPNWQTFVRGDVFADKSVTDIYVGMKHTLASEGWLMFQWVLPRAYFNEKTTRNDRFLDRPHSFFVQGMWPHSHGHTLMSATLSPDSRLQSVSQGDTVTSRQHRLALQHLQHRGDWQWQLELAAESTRRDHQLVEFVRPQLFLRDMAEAGVTVRYLAHRYQPMAGVNVMRLEETGWFGREINAHAVVKRREPVVFAGLRWPLASPHQRLEPTVYLSRPTVRQTLTREWALRDEDDWIGKLSVPWVWQVKEENGATLTLALSMELHRIQFGGGNLQFHWPL